MPVTWSVVNNRVLVIATIGGYETSEWIAAIEEARRDSRVGPATTVLFDTRASLVYLSPEELTWRTEWFATVCREGSFRRCAFLTATNAYRVQVIEPGVTGLRQHGIETAAFTDRDAAFRWAMESDDQAPPLP